MGNLFVVQIFLAYNSFCNSLPLWVESPPQSPPASVSVSVRAVLACTSRQHRWGADPWIAHDHGHLQSSCLC